MEGGGKEGAGHGAPGEQRDLEAQLRELRCKTRAQEQCIVEYKKETEKLTTLTHGTASGEDLHVHVGMMKVWLRDARQQSDDLRHLFEESKAIAAETLAATKRELHSHISKLQEQVVKLEADVVKAAGARSGAEEDAEKLRHELVTAKREADLLRSEFATSSGEMSGKLTVRQNVTKGEICKLSAEVFTLQQNLMEQAQKSAEAEKKGAQAYQQDLVSLNSLLERSREMRERDRTTFAAALDVAHSDLRNKETEVKEAEDKLLDVVNQLSSSRRHCAGLLQEAENVRKIASSKDDESAERVVRASRMRTTMTHLRSVICRWRQAARPDYDVSAGMAGLYAKRRIAKLFHQWRGGFSTRLRTAHKLNAFWQRWKVKRVLLKFLFWRRYAASRRHLQSAARRIASRSSKFTSRSTFRTWCLKARISANLRSQQVRATARWDRLCLKRCLRGMQSLSVDGKRRLVHGQRLVSRICRRELLSVLHKWHCRTKDLQDQVAAFQARRSCVLSRGVLSAAFDSWSICMAPASESGRDSAACRFARKLQRRRRIRMYCCAWQSHARSRNCLRSKVLRANDHIAQTRKGRAIRSLRAHVRLQNLLTLRYKRVLAKSDRILLAGTMRTWCELWIDRKTCSARNLRCAARLRRSRLIMTVQKWRTGGAEVRFEISLMRKADITYMNKLAMRAFARMVDNRFESFALKRRTISILHRRLTKLCSWSLNMWMHSMYARWHRSKRDAAVNLRRHRQKRFIMQRSAAKWLEYAGRRIFTARIVKTASLKRAHATIAAALLSWELLLRRSLAVKSAKTRKRRLLRATTLNAWSHLTDSSRIETSNREEIDRLCCELKETKSDLEVVSSREMDSQEQLNQLHDVRIPALESENLRMSETLELAQMELEAKKAEALSTKTQVSMLQDSIAEMRGFLNDPDLNHHSDTAFTDEKSAASVRKELEAERRNVAKLHSESLHKDAEISQLTSQVTAMEQKVARAQKSIDSLEAQTSSDIQSVLHEKALAEQMFADLQVKLTDQFRAESEAKEAEISALKAHVSVLQTALAEMRRDLDETPRETVASLPKSTSTVDPHGDSHFSSGSGEPPSPEVPDQHGRDSKPSEASVLDTCDADYRALSGTSDTREQPPFGKDGSAKPSPLVANPVSGDSSRETQLPKRGWDVEGAPGQTSSKESYGSSISTAPWQSDKEFNEKRALSGGDLSWQVRSDCASPPGSAELSSAPTKRDDETCDVSAVPSSSPSLQSPSINVDAAGYSISQPSPADCSQVVEISVAMAPSPAVGALMANDLFQQHDPPANLAADRMKLMQADKENQLVREGGGGGDGGGGGGGGGGGLEDSGSVDDSSIDGSHVASVTLSGRESISSATDMTVLGDPTRRAISAEPNIMRSVTTSFSRRALGPTNASLSTLSRHSRSRKLPATEEGSTVSIVGVARSKPVAPAVARKAAVQSSGSSASAASSRAATSKQTLARSRRKRDYSLDSDSD